MVLVNEKRAAQRGTKSATSVQADGRFEIVHRRWLPALAALSYLLSLPLFAPWSIWPLAYVAFVPWLLGVCAAGRSRWVYITSYLLGCAFFFTHWRWLYDTTAPGYIAGALFFALYFPLAAWPVRHFYRQRHWNVAIVFAVVWTMTELMRSRGPLAFPWFLLGHTQIRLLSLVQIADLTGVYGISFIVAMVNGLIVQSILYKLTPLHDDVKRQLMVSTATAVIMMAAALGYGFFRLSTLEMKEGPKVAVLQGDFLLSPIDDPKAAGDEDKQRFYLDVMQKAAGQADLIVLPETPWPMYLNRELRELSAEQLSDIPQSESRWVKMFMREARDWHSRLSDFVRKHETYLVIGAMSQEPQPKNTYPQTHRYNSAFLYPPTGKEPARYDKIHLVLFGEFVPFRYNQWLHSFYLWLNSITPWGAGGFEYSLTAGREYKVFPIPERENAGPLRHFGITICYEDVIPQVFRRFIVDSTGRKRVDFMLNISNDGWFGHGDQQPQHLVNCAFRAIENRVGVARAVNTGVSGFIRPDGSWYSLVAENSKSPRAGGTGWQMARVMSSPRVTFYGRFGDVFGFTCAILGLCGIADAIFLRRIKVAA